MSEWREVVLGDLCSRITVGHVGKMANEYVDAGIPYLRSKDIHPFEVDSASLLRISPEFHRKLAKSELHHGDVVVVRTGYPGTAAVVPPALDGANCSDLVIITPSDQLNSHLLAAVFNSAWGRAAVSGNLVGSAQQHFNVGAAKALRMMLPQKVEQDRIADVLCSMNDLIENTRRRIARLEQMAQAIYQEWFVHFRYPGHEQEEFVGSALGQIPARWEVLPVSLAVEINPSVTGQRGSDVPFVAMADLDPGLMHVMPSSTRTFGGGGSKFERHDILFARITPSVENGKTGFVQFLADGEIAMGSTEFLIFRGRRISAYSAYLLTRQDGLRQHAIGSMSGASGRQRVNDACFDTFVVAVPPPGLDRRFAESVAAMFAAVELLSQTNLRLARIRDELLPKLVTGTIDVSRLDLDALLDKQAA